eukprot:GGOE01004865.1.p2 GENE.GGOE01004865.1~~GGOE01004865.1.p2  ORF type:complete len:114 (-),score=33.64 GGOE01004865.1:454-795(-)
MLGCASSATASTTASTASTTSSGMHTTLSSSHRSDPAATLTGWTPDRFAETIGYHNTPSGKYRELDSASTTRSSLREDVGPKPSRVAKSSQLCETGDRHAHFAPEEGLLQVYN